MLERESFKDKASMLAGILDKLRPGTGSAIEILLLQAWDAGYEAGERKERERCAKVAEDHKSWKKKFPRDFGVSNLTTAGRYIAEVIRGGESTND